MASLNFYEKKSEISILKKCSVSEYQEKKNSSKFNVPIIICSAIWGKAFFRMALGWGIHPAFSFIVSKGIKPIW